MRLKDMKFGHSKNFTWGGLVRLTNVDLACVEPKFLEG